MAVRPIATAMTAAELGGVPALVVGVPSDEVYVVWNPLNYSLIDLQAVRNHTMPGVVLTCSSIAASSQFGYSLAIYKAAIAIGAPNATTGMIFVVNNTYTFPNDTIDICSQPYSANTWNITNLQGMPSSRLGNIIKSDEIYGNAVLAFTEGALQSHDKTVYVATSITQSCNVADLSAPNSGIQGFKGVVPASMNSTSLTAIEIGHLQQNNDVVLIGCPNCNFQNKITGVVFYWSISANHQPVSEPIGVQGTVYYSGLNQSAFFGVSVSTKGGMVMIGAPGVKQEGIVYDFSPAGVQTFRGNQDLKGNNAVISILPNISHSFFGFEVKIGEFKGAETQMIGSPFCNYSTGCIDILLNAKLPQGGVALETGQPTFAEMYFHLTSNAPDSSMIGSGVLDIFSIQGKDIIAIAGLNATEAWLINTLSCPNS